MATFEITIYQSEELYNSDGTTPLYRAKEYIEGTFGRSSHSVSVDINTSPLWAPQQEIHSSFSAEHPCDGSYYAVDYNDLGQWWKDYVQCQLSESNDADMLLTNTDSGGITYNNQYCACNAAEISNCSSTFQDYGYGAEYNAMRSVLHEFGHALLDVNESVDPSYLPVNNPEHNVGNTVTRQVGTAEYVYRTPMGYGGEGNHDNQCDNPVYDAHTNNCAEFEFADCADGRFDHY